MKKDELNKFIYISIAFSACMALGYITYYNKVDLETFIRGVSLSITIITFFWSFYFLYGWKWWLLRKIFYRPNLNGTWQGNFVSDWGKNEGEMGDPNDFFIVIRQNFLRIHFTTYTKTFIGYSYSETLNLKKETGLKNVSYLYRKDTSQSNDDNLREGATELRLIINEANESKKLEGKFWTNTRTQGKISVSFLTDDHLDSFDCVINFQNGKTS